MGDVLLSPKGGTTWRGVILTKSHYDFHLTKRVYKILLAKGVRLICYKCGEPLKVGDQIVSHRSYKRKRYHEACWKSLFIENV